MKGRTWALIDRTGAFKKAEHEDTHGPATISVKEQTRYVVGRKIENASDVLYLVSKGRMAQSKLVNPAQMSEHDQKNRLSLLKGTHNHTLALTGAVMSSGSGLMGSRGMGSRGRSQNGSTSAHHHHGDIFDVWCDIEFNQKHMSREHCILQHGRDGCLYLVDLNSKSGTYVKKADGSDMHLVRDDPEKDNGFGKLKPMKFVRLERGDKLIFGLSRMSRQYTVRGPRAKKPPVYEPLIADSTFDVWSMGVVFYRALAMRPLFEGDDKDDLAGDREKRALADWGPIALKMAIMRVNYKVRVAGDVSNRTRHLACDLLAWMLQREPSARPSCMQVLAHPFLSQQMSVRARSGELHRAAELDDCSKVSDRAGRHASRAAHFGHTAGTPRAHHRATGLR